MPRSSSDSHSGESDEDSGTSGEEEEQYVSSWQQLKADLNSTSNASNNGESSVLHSKLEGSVFDGTRDIGGAASGPSASMGWPLQLLPLVPAEAASNRSNDDGFYRSDQQQQEIDASDDLNDDAEVADAARDFLAQLEAKTARAVGKSLSLGRRQSAEVHSDSSNNSDSDSPSIPRGESAAPNNRRGHHYDASSEVLRKAHLAVGGSAAAANHEAGQTPGIISEILKRLGQPPLCDEATESGDNVDDAAEAERLLSEADRRAAEEEARGIVNAWWGVEQEAVAIRRRNAKEQRVKGPPPQQPKRRSREIGMRRDAMQGAGASQTYTTWDSSQDRRRGRSNKDVSGSRPALKGRRQQPRKNSNRPSSIKSGASRSKTKESKNSDKHLSLRIGF